MPGKSKNLQTFNIGVISGYPLKLHDSNSMQNEKSTGLALYGPAHSRGNKPG